MDVDRGKSREICAIFQQARAPTRGDDLEKFQRIAPVRVTNIARMRHWVTERRPDQGTLSMCTAAGVRLVTPEGVL